MLWVMRNFDPSGLLRASVRDIIADQQGTLFSIDQEVERLITADNAFRLRVWSVNGDEQSWSNAILPIRECVQLAAHRRWPDDFKKRWADDYKGIDYRDPLAPNIADRLIELRDQLKFTLDVEELISLLPIIRLLISLESGFVSGSNHKELISLANRFDDGDNYKALNLVLKAIEYWKPELLTRSSMQNAIKRAEVRLRLAGPKPWGQTSLIGRVREVLFPDWKLN